MEEEAVAARAQILRENMQKNNDEFIRRQTVEMKDAVETPRKDEVEQLRRRIETLEKEKKELEKRGCMEEVENRQMRAEQYRETIEAKAEEPSTWNQILVGAGQFLGSAAGAFASNFTPTGRVATVLNWATGWLGLE